MLDGDAKPLVWHLPVSGHSRTSIRRRFDDKLARGALEKTAKSQNPCLILSCYRCNVAYYRKAGTSITHLLRRDSVGPALKFNVPTSLKANLVGQRPQSAPQ